MIRDEPAFAASLSPEMLRRVLLVAKALCRARDDDDDDWDEEETADR